MTHYVVDADSFAYKAAAVCEERKIEVTYTKSGKKKVFKNRTKFTEYLEDLEKNGKSFPKEDFEVLDIQEATEPVEAFRIVKGIVNAALIKAGYNELLDTYKLYVGKGKTFRHEKATILEYKGNRHGVKPVLLKACLNYLTKNFNTEVVEGIEADDAVNIAGVQGYINWKASGEDYDKVVVISIDKDSKAGPGWLFNPDKDETPRLVEGFGKLFLDEKGRPDGYGRVWSYYQILYGDPVDNYFANSASTKKYGAKSAYKALVDCKTDEEAMKAVVNEYRKLYPKPVKIINWKGEELEVDWLYALKENAMLATMMTDNTTKMIDIEEVLKHFKIT